MRRVLAGLLVASVSVACAAASAPSRELSELERAGQAIFLRGESLSGARLTAHAGLGGLQLEGPALACANCHGEDGRGRREAGVVVPSIRWSELSKPWGRRLADGRERAPMDAAGLHRAVTEGLDFEGQRLQPAMPRFAISHRDLAALGAYLQRLDDPLVPGVDRDRLRLGTWWPAQGRSALTGAAVRRQWQQRLDEINREGGIHGRQLELVHDEPPADPAAAADHLKHWASQADVLLLLSPWSAGFEEALNGAADAARLPVLAPLTLYPDDDADASQQIFHLQPGVVQLAQGLARHLVAQDAVVKRDRSRPMALLHAEHVASRKAAQTLAARLRDDGWSQPVPVGIAATGPEGLAQLAATLKRLDVGTVILLAPGADVAGLVQAGARIGWQAEAWLVPATLSARQLAQAAALLEGRAWIAYPAVSAVPASGSGAPAHAGSLGLADPPTPAAARVALELLIDVLKRAGRDVDRARLLHELESVQGFRAAGMPSIGFTRARRMGSSEFQVWALEAQGMRSLGVSNGEY